MLMLRDYQEQGTSDIREAFGEGYEAPLYVCPTGGGKTVIFSYIANNAMLKNNQVLILVHRIELLKQTSKALQKSSVGHGLINSKFTPNLNHLVQVASVQTLANRLDRYKIKPSLIIIDEAHHATASSWRKVIEHYPGAKILGVTATPIRRDGAGLGKPAGGLFDKLIMGPQVAELMNRPEKYLVKPTVYAPIEQIDVSDVDVVMGDFVTSQLESKVDRPRITGNAVKEYSLRCPREPCVVFCVSVEHAEKVAAAFKASGFNFKAVDGTMADDEREAILNGLADGTIDGVCSCDLISEGTDIPAIGCVILLRPTTSLGLYLQQVGRGLRPSPGKFCCIILDHAGNVIRHGMPDDVRQWSLEGDKKQKKRKNRRNNGPKAKPCPSCRIVHAPAPECPGCGLQYELPTGLPLEVEGTLSEVTDEMAIIIKSQKMKEVGEARTLTELEDLAKARGYNKEWALNVYNLRIRTANS